MTVFEGVSLERPLGEQIFRIMSAPIVDEGKAIGVVQISRKGLSAKEAGDNFSPGDLHALITLGLALGRIVMVWQGPIDNAYRQNHHEMECR